jgi:hypothetical protein
MKPRDITKGVINIMTPAIGSPSSEAKLIVGCGFADVDKIISTSANLKHIAISPVCPNSSIPDTPDRDCPFISVPHAIQRGRVDITCVVRTIKYKGGIPVPDPGTRSHYGNIAQERPVSG